MRETGKPLLGGYSMKWRNLAILEDNVMDHDWAFLCRFDIRDENEKLYLRRYRLFQTPWFGMYIHKICRPDQGRDPHDHPWNFSALILKNGYCETTIMDGKAGRQWFKFGDWSRHKAEDFHIIENFHFKYGNTWTLFLTGKRRRNWGFLTEEGWVSHQEYTGEK